MDRRLFQDRRLSEAFPNLRHDRADAWEELKSRLKGAGRGKKNPGDQEGGHAADL